MIQNLYDAAFNGDEARVNALMHSSDEYDELKSVIQGYVHGKHHVLIGRLLSGTMIRQNSMPAAHLLVVGEYVQTGQFTTKNGVIDVLAALPNVPMRMTIFSMINIFGRKNLMYKEARANITHCSQEVLDEANNLGALMADYHLNLDQARMWLYPNPSAVDVSLEDQIDLLDKMVFVATKPTLMKRLREFKAAGNDPHQDILKSKAKKLIPLLESAESRKQLVFFLRRNMDVVDAYSLQGHLEQLERPDEDYTLKRNEAIGLPEQLEKPKKYAVGFFNSREQMQQQMVIRPIGSIQGMSYLDAELNSNPIRKSPR